MKHWREFETSEELSLSFSVVVEKDRDLSVLENMP